MSANQTLSFAAPITLKAGKVPTFDAIAYSGGLMFPTINGRPVRAVVDLAGLKAAAPFPLTRDHDNARPVGHGETVVNNGRTLTTSGLLSQTNADAVEVLAAARNKFPWQASVDLHIEDTTQVQAGESKQVNGRRIDGPFILVNRSTLKAVSVVAVGADAQSSFNLAAKAAKGNLMTPGFENTVSDLLGSNDTNTPDPVTVAADTKERNRVQGILKAARSQGGVSQELLDDAIDRGLDPNAAELMFLRASRPKAIAAAMPAIERRADHTNGVDVLTAAMLSKVGLSRVAEAEYGERVMDQAHRYRDSHAMDIMRAGLMLDHVDVPSGGKMEMLRAAFSTRSITNVLSNVANKSIAAGFMETPATWRSFANIKSASNFKTQTGVRLNMRGQVEETPAGGNIPHAELTDETFAWNIGTFTKQLGLTRQDIINDDLGMFDDAGRALGRMAMRGLNDKVYSTLLGAGSFFHADNGNLITNALTIDGLSNAVKSMMKQRDVDGNDLDIRPATLLVPPELADVAKQILESEQVTHIVTDSAAPASLSQYGTGNPQRNTVKLEIEPRLSNTVKFTTADVNNWYLFASPADMAIVAGFLNGVETPTVEFFGLDSNPNVLGVSWRVYFDYGAALGDYRAAVKSNVS